MGSRLSGHEVNDEEETRTDRLKTLPTAMNLPSWLVPTQTPSCPPSAELWIYRLSRCKVHQMFHCFQLVCSSSIALFPLIIFFCCFMSLPTHLHDPNSIQDGIPSSFGKWMCLSAIKKKGSPTEIDVNTSQLSTSTGKKQKAKQMMTQCTGKKMQSKLNSLK